MFTNDKKRPVTTLCRNIPCRETYLYHYEENLQKQILKSQRIEKANKSTGIIVSGVSNADVKLGNCCNCIPGDPIVGYISKGNGVIVHSINCKNIKETQFWLS